MFADVDPCGGDLDPASVAASVGPRTRAVMVTHLGGTPADLGELYTLADHHGIALVEDAAHACGSTYRDVRIGGHRGMHAFSFQATKNLTTIDGGMLCLRSADDARRARRLRWMGIDQDTWSRNRSDGYRWSYEVTELGHKYAMNDLNTAIGLAHLPRARGRERPTPGHRGALRQGPRRLAGRRGDRSARRPVQRDLPLPDPRGAA